MRVTLTLTLTLTRQSGGLDVPVRRGHRRPRRAAARCHRARRAHRPPLLAQALAPGPHQEAGPPRARRSRRYGRRLTADKKSGGGPSFFAAPVTSPPAQAAPCVGECVGECFKLTRRGQPERRSRASGRPWNSPFYSALDWRRFFCPSFLGGDKQRKCCPSRAGGARGRPGGAGGRVPRDTYLDLHGGKDSTVSPGKFDDA